MASNDPAVLTESDRLRFERIYFRARHTKSSTAIVLYQRLWSFEWAAKLLLGIFLLVLIFLYGAIWAPGAYDPARIEKDLSGMLPSFMPVYFPLKRAVLLVFLIALLIAPLFKIRYVAKRRAGRPLRARLSRILHLAALALPGSLIVGLTWKNSDNMKMGPREPIRLNLNKTNVRRPATLGKLFSHKIFLAICIFDFFSPLLIAAWLVAPIQNQQTLLTICIMAHLSFFILALYFAHLAAQRSRAMGWRKLIIWIRPFLCLTPLPGPFFAFTMGTPRMVSSLLVSKTFERPRSGGTSLWPALEASMRLRWPGESWRSRWRKPVQEKTEFHSVTGSHLLSFFRLKLMMLQFDVPFFFICLSQLSKRFTSLGQLLLVALRIDGLVFLLLAGGFLIQLWRVATRKLRLSFQTAFLARYPYGRYLLLTGTAYSLGSLGLSLLWERSQSRGNTIELFMVLGALLALFTLTTWPQSEPRIRSRSPVAPQVLWVLLSLSVAVLAFMMRNDESLLYRFLLVLLALVVLSPLWNLILFFTLRGWLLRPFSSKHVFNRKLPFRFRVALAFMILSAALPLGGLAIPFWIYARHRLWPRCEELLWKLKLS